MDRLSDLKLSERPAGCPDHGGYMSRNLFGRVWSKCPQCSAIEQEAEDALRKADELRQAEKRHRAMLDSARIPAKFVGCTFESFVVDSDAKRHACTVARDFAENFDAYARKGSALIMAGKPGTGKSHLAGAILQSLITRQVRYLTCMDLIRAVRETWRRDSERSESQILGYLESLDLLVIDEVGMQYGTEGEQNVLFDVLDRRYREVKPVILLTNQDKAGFKTFVGDRCYDRLVETSRWIPFDWQSYRATARKSA